VTYFFEGDLIRPFSKGDLTGCRGSTFLFHSPYWDSERGKALLSSETFFFFFHIMGLNYIHSVRGYYTGGGYDYLSLRIPESNGISEAIRSNGMNIYYYYYYYLKIFAALGIKWDFFLFI
jgi:hypothetical protein